MTRAQVPYLLAVLIFAAAAGCGIDDPRAPLAVGGLTTLLFERTFSQGDLEISEQVLVTNLDIGTNFHLNATVLNLGPDLPNARFEMLTQRQLDVFGGGTELRPPEVVAIQDLGTLHSSQTQGVALEHRELGFTRILISGRVVSGP